MTQLARDLCSLFKLRIGVMITLTAVAGLAMTPGASVPWWETLVLALAVLLASASAGGFNQYVETDLDARMERTRSRPFITGTLTHHRAWVWLLYGLLAAGVTLAAFVLNGWAAFYVFLGAFFYAVVYTVWLKRRSWLNIVLGGLAGSFAVLAGAAVVDPTLGVVPLLFALVLFLWTPPHFWSLAIALKEDYRAAGVPMLPVLVGEERAARIVALNTAALVGVSLLPAAFGLGWLYLAGAALGGGYFLYKTLELVREPGPQRAMAAFHASLVQLTLMLTAGVIDAQLLG